MFAMGRLYQTGKMNKEAGVLYDYLMTRDTEDQAARVGAIDVALSENNVQKATTLASGLRSDSSPERMLLLARLEEAKGNHQQAMTYLRSARGKLVGLLRRRLAAYCWQIIRLLPPVKRRRSRVLHRRCTALFCRGRSRKWLVSRGAVYRAQPVPICRSRPRKAARCVRLIT